MRSHFQSKYFSLSIAFLLLPVVLGNSPLECIVGVEVRVCEVLTRLSATIVGSFLVFILMYTKLKTNFLQSVQVFIVIIMTKKDDVVLSDQPSPILEHY